MKKLFSRCIGKKRAIANPPCRPPVPLLDADTSKCLVHTDHQSLWDEAYDALKCENPETVKEYEILLSKELRISNSASNDPVPMDSVENLINTDPKSRQNQFSKISEQGLKRMDEKKLEYTIAGRQFVLRDQITQAVNLVQGVKASIDNIVLRSPEVSMAWAGVCIILPLLTNPKTADEANRDGFTYVTTRMDYYIALEPMLSRLYQSAEVPDDLVKAHVKDLYQGILDFQIRSVLRFYRSQRWNQFNQINPGPKSDLTAIFDARRLID